MTPRYQAPLRRGFVILAILASTCSPLPAPAMTLQWFPVTAWEDGAAMLPGEAERIVVRVWRTTNPANVPTLVKSSAPGADNVTVPNPTRGTFYYYRGQSCLDNADAWCSAPGPWKGVLWLTGPMPDSMEITPR